MTNKKSYTGSGYTCMFLLTALIFSLLICLFINNGMADAAGKEGYISEGRTNVYFRESPGGNPVQENRSNIMLNGGQALTSLTPLTVPGIRLLWYITEQLIPDMYLHHLSPSGKKKIHRIPKLQQQVPAVPIPTLKHI